MASVASLYELGACAASIPTGCDCYFEDSICFHCRFHCYNITHKRLKVKRYFHKVIHNHTYTYYLRGGPPLYRFFLEKQIQLLKLSCLILNYDDHLKAEVFGDDIKYHANCCTDEVCFDVFHFFSLFCLKSNPRFLNALLHCRILKILFGLELLTLPVRLANRLNFFGRYLLIYEARSG